MIKPFDNALGINIKLYKTESTANNIRPQQYKEIFFGRDTIDFHPVEKMTPAFIPIELSYNILVSLASISKSFQHSWLCVCVCVCEREREKSRLFKFSLSWTKMLELILLNSICVLKCFSLQGENTWIIQNSEDMSLTPYSASWFILAKVKYPSPRRSFLNCDI